MQVSTSHSLTTISLIGLLLCGCTRPMDQPLETKDDSIEIIPLQTGRNFKFKGLALDSIHQAAYLGSWDKKQIVRVDLKDFTHQVIPTPYSGRLNGMGCFIRNGIVFAVMNEIDDTKPDVVSVLLLIDATTNKFIRAYEARGVDSRNHFNHVVVSTTGVAYISNTLQSSIFTVDTNNHLDSLRVLVKHPDLSWVHGLDLSADEKTLYATSYDGGIKILNLDDLDFSPYRDTTLAGDDGLRYYKGSLYGVGDDTIKKYTLSADGQSVASTELILKQHPYFNDARCLAIQNDYLYVLANIEFDPVAFDESPRLDTLKDTHLIKIRLQ